MTGRRSDIPVMLDKVRSRRVVFGSDSRWEEASKPAEGCLPEHRRAALAAAAAAGDANAGESADGDADITDRATAALAAAIAAAAGAAAGQEKTSSTN
ncbi:hypothetical protein CLOM_g21234 [Closterium sp. NIES-68]|nr:hypothetical protein CLOM_g21234 [Closterium sp. NIES-68]